MTETTKTIRLNNGVEMPLLGLGVYKALGNDAQQAVSCALEHGYRLIVPESAFLPQKSMILFCQLCVIIPHRGDKFKRAATDFCINFM